MTIMIITFLFSSRVRHCQSQMASSKSFGESSMLPASPDVVFGSLSVKVHSEEDGREGPISVPRKPSQP